MCQQCDMKRRWFFGKARMRLDRLSETRAPRNASESATEPVIIGQGDYEDKVKVGFKVRAVWNDDAKRNGTLFDIKYFEPFGN